jgi:hypothetical protein
MTIFRQSILALSLLVTVGGRCVLADDVLPNVGGAGGPGAVCFGGNFVVVGAPNPSARCDGGKVLHPEVANYLLLKDINDRLASSLASQDRFQKEMLSKLQTMYDALLKRIDASK